MSSSNAPDPGASAIRPAPRARSAAPETRRVIAKPNIPVVRPARVADDGRFLRWIEYAKEALPVDVAEIATEEEEAEQAEKSLAHIPAAIIVKRHGKSKAKDGTPATLPTKDDPKKQIEPRKPRSTEKPKAALKNLAGKVPQGTEQVPGKRDAAAGGTSGNSVEAKELDTSRFTSFDDYNQGKTRVTPLQRGSAIDGKRALERPKFLDGKLPRSVERGVLHPQPARIVISGILLLLAKALLIAVVLVMPILAVLDGMMPADNRYLIKQALPLLLVFAVVGLVFIVVANKARCRVCSCHFFFTRRCHKHKSAHRLIFFGAAGTAALHLLLFKWMRCMYCGTAIRLRGSTGVGKPTKTKAGEYEEDEDDEEAG